MQCKDMVGSPGSVMLPCKRCILHLPIRSPACRPQKQLLTQAKGGGEGFGSSKQKKKQKGGESSPTDPTTASGKSLSRSGKPIGWSFLPKDDEKAKEEAGSTAQEDAAGEGDPIALRVDLLAGGDIAGDGTEELPGVSRGQVFKSCAQVSGTLAIAAFALHQYATFGAASMGSDPQEVARLLAVPGELEWWHPLVALGVAGAVTGARQALLQTWPAFAAATDRSNTQVLTPLLPADLVWLAFFPGISEELFFRGSLIPAVFPDWRGVLFSGAIFGLLHNSGGRNWQFAVWAGAVGTLYGAAFISTHNVLVPIVAHSMANLAGGLLWLNGQNKK